MSISNNISKKKIGIDARFYGPIGKGLGRYTKELVDRVIVMDAENDYVIFLSPENYSNFNTVRPGVKKVLVKARWYTMAEQIVMPYLILREKIDMMHFPHFNVPVFCPVKFLVTIHDLILTKHPTKRATTLSPILYWLKNLGYRIVIGQATRRAQVIIAVSGYTAEDIAKNFSVDKKKIVVTYEGVAKKFSMCERWNDQTLLAKYGISKPFLMYVGNAYPHKNLEKLINVFLKIKDKHNVNLIIVGPDDYFFKRIKDMAVNEKSVVFPGYVPDEDLSCLYKNALAYVFPSLFEGFGLPPLEAMSQGCAVASSNKTCLPEVLGDAALYFNPEDDNDIQSKLERIITDSGLRQALIEKGFIRANRFNWDDCARSTLSEYNKLI